jgi:lipopolysaccharide/colanic/teichoic acid biosynthesis glycosyltransferase
MTSDRIKRAADAAVSAAVLTLAGPAMLAIAAAIKLASPGPVLYRGLRAGRYGRPFHILKFRTMVLDAEARGGSATAADDPRITSVGRWLRRSKLDELPQFINVLRGEMALGGPRPEVEKYARLYTGDESKVMDLRPGITDWATIWNADEGRVLEGSTDPEADYERLIRPTKVRLQLLYARNQSLTIDAKILCYTLIRMFRRDWLPPEIAGYGLPRCCREDVPATGQPQRCAQS